MAKYTRYVRSIGKSDYEIIVTNNLPSISVSIMVLGVMKSSTIDYNLTLTRNGYGISGSGFFGTLGPRRKHTRTFTNVMNKGDLKIGYSLTKANGSATGGSVNVPQ